MNKAVTHSFQGMNQDIRKSSFPNEFYFEGKNIRIIATDSQTTGAVTNEKGNKLIYQIPIPTIDYNKKEISYIYQSQSSSEINLAIIGPITPPNTKILKYETDEITEMSNQDPSQPGTQYIIGHTTTRKYVILFTSDEAGFDCIWRIDLESQFYDIELLYLRNMLFSREHPIQAINNFENKIIDKVYWVDGVHQVRFINIEHSIENEDLENLIDVSLSTIDMVGQFDVSQPIVVNILSGGIHTAGMIQYAYNLYKVNSSQTRLSPLSQLVALDKDVLGGGALNEIVGATPVIHINDIDEDYTHIKTYAIKYTSYNELPTISIIDDREVPSSRSIEIFDDGSKITDISIEEFLFLGSDIIIPKHINSKDNRLLLANYEERNYNVELDVRAYSFDNTGKAFVYDNIKIYNQTDTTPDVRGLTGEETFIDPVAFTDDPEDRSDSINLDYDKYKYQTDGATFGGEGKYLMYELTQHGLNDPDNRYFKDEEIYRLGIEFINGYGQYSLPRWIADFKSREGNLRGQFNTLRFTLKPEFFTWLDGDNFDTEFDKPVGYRVLIADRTVNDRTIVANGLISPMMINDKSTKDVRYPGDVQYVRDKADSIPKLPNLLVRNVGSNQVYGDWTRHFGSNTRPLELAKNLQQMSVQRQSPDTEFQRATSGDDDTAARFYQYNAMYQLYSPELIFNESVQLSSDYEFKVKGGLINTYNAIWGKTFEASSGSSAVIKHEGKGKQGVSLTYANTRTTITGDGENPQSNGLISHPLGSSSDRVAFTSYYRGYGDVPINDTFDTSSYIVSMTWDFAVVTGPMPPVGDDITIPEYPNNAIRFASNNRDTIFTTYGANRKVILKYTITPEVGFEAITYTASLTSDSEGNNILHTKTGIGEQFVELQTTPINQQVKTDFGNTFKEYHNYLKITSTDAIILKVVVDAEIRNASNNNLLVSVTSPNPDPLIVPSLTNFVNLTNEGVVPISVSFKPTINKKIYDIYGIPEITVRGQNVTNYNDDGNYKYINTFMDIRSDRDSDWKNGGKYGRSLISSNSEGNRTITFVLGDDDPNVKYYNRPLLEQLYTEGGFSADSTATNLGLIGEIVKPREQIYLGNIYGGNSWEDKKRTRYIEIGNFQEFGLVGASTLILSPGDTFVNYFKFLRVLPKTPTVISEGVPTWQEAVEFYTETTLDIKNRNDLSFGTWDSRFHFTEAEYHQYNRVYSQMSNLITQRDLDFNVKKVNSFDTNIIASKEKSAGEIVDSWTDLLQNEVMTLDGKHGAINSLTSFNDDIYAIQDEAFAYISINPRVQVQAQDGLSIELGTGQVLAEYKYISTSSGTLNKWAVVTSPQAIYYYDTLNSMFNSFRGSIVGLSDLKGIHTFLVNNTSLNELKIDNPLLLKGISSGYDFVNNDIFFTFHQDTEIDFTFSFNELTDTFISFYDYLPTMYISKGSFLIAVHPDDTKLYRQYAGKYNEFFDKKYKSSITFNSNPDALLDCVFDNINFKSEVYDMPSGLDVPDKTLTHIRAYDDYQDSGLVPLIVGRNNNLRRKFRDWNALIPREKRNRIRAPWIKLQLDFDNTTTEKDYKFVLHPVNIFYTI